MQFEFKIVRVSHDARYVSTELPLDDHLKMLGLEGFKVVGVTGDGLNDTVYLQRRKPEYSGFGNSS